MMQPSLRAYPQAQCAVAPLAGVRMAGWFGTIAGAAQPAIADNRADAPGGSVTEAGMLS
jgi:hypothetical protein